MNTYQLIEILIPLGVCVVLPVLIVWLVTRVSKNETDRKAEIMLKAIEAGTPVDPTVFNNNKKKSVKKDLLEKLNGACITGLMGLGFLILKLTGIKIGFGGDFLVLGAVVMIAVGIGLFVSYFVGKKMLAKEIELEEKNLSEQK